MGSETTEVAANKAWKQLLESYEDPGLDPAIDEELQAYIASRRQAPDLFAED
jgi:trimethylamine---corrinoid protein Co-methyltransferase